MRASNIFWDIRRAKNSDFIDMRALEHQCFSTEAYDDELLWQMLNETLGFITWIALDPSSKNAVGYVTLHVNDDDDATIVSICVNRSHQQKGIGTALLKNAIEFAKKIRLQRLYLTVSVNNHPAINLYRKMGFVDMGFIPHYYSNGDDARVMVLTIKNQLSGQ